MNGKKRSGYARIGEVDIGDGSTDQVYKSIG